MRWRSNSSNGIRAIPTRYLYPGVCKLVCKPCCKLPFPCLLDPIIAAFYKHPRSAGANVLKRGCNSPWPPHKSPMALFLGHLLFIRFVDDSNSDDLGDKPVQFSTTAPGLCESNRWCTPSRSNASTWLQVSPSHHANGSCCRRCRTVSEGLVAVCQSQKWFTTKTSD